MQKQKIKLSKLKSKGRKLCTSCNNYVACRTIDCVCGFKFNIKPVNKKLKVELDDVSELGVSFWIDRLIEEQSDYIIKQGLRYIVRSNYPENYDNICEHIEKYFIEKNNESESSKTIEDVLLVE